MNVRGYEQYKVNEAAVSSPGKLVVKAYDSMVRFLTEAEAAASTGNYDLYNERIRRCQSIVTMLCAMLNEQQDPKLYTTIIELNKWYIVRLAEANLTEDPALFAELKKEFSEMRDAWAKAEQNSAATQTAAYQQRVQQSAPATTLAEAA